MVTLNIEKRESKTSLASLRAGGKIPAVYYGRKEHSTPIAVPKAEFLRVWREAGEFAVVTLKGAGEEHDSLIKDTDLDPVTGEFRHVDFYVIEKGKKLQVAVPITYVGVAPATKDLGGILVKVLHNLKIEAMPKDLPRSIEVDVSVLATLDSAIHAKDLVLPAGVTLVEKPEEIVASITKYVEEKEEVAAPDLSAIEVEKKGKEAVEGEAGAEGAAPAEAKKEEKK